MLLQMSNGSPYDRLLSDPMVCCCLQRRQVLTWQLPRQPGRQTQVNTGLGCLTAYLQSGHGLLLSSPKATQSTQTTLESLLICTSPSAARDEAEETVTTAW